MTNCQTCKHFVSCELAKQSFIKISDINCEEYTPVCKYCGSDIKAKFYASGICYTCRMKLEKVRELKRLLKALVPYQIQRNKEDEALISDYTKFLIDRSDKGIISISDLPDLLFDFKEAKNDR